MRTTLSLGATVLCLLSLFAGCGAQPVQEASVAQGAPGAIQPGWQAGVDAEGRVTGELPEAQPVEDLSKRMRVTTRKDGLVELNFNDVLLSETRATVLPDGTISMECTPPATPAQAAGEARQEGSH